MSSYTLKIELMSDLCVSDGGVYNSMLDTDICYDRYGFPYIPAKRIKGCLRECALELIDWEEKIRSDEIFGSGGKRQNAGKIRISDAILSDCREYAEEVREYDGSTLYHPQNVLNCYSYIRTQTGIDYETGAADDKSLRTIRVADKGLRFESEIEIDDGYYEELKKCVEIFTNMGIGRTRGLGEIRCELEPAAARNPGSETSGGDGAAVAAENCPENEEDAVVLFYRLDLEEPMVCKSVNGGEARTLDYIEGSKILGIILGRLREKGEDIGAFLDGIQTEAAVSSEGNASCTEKTSDSSASPLIVSNAYLTEVVKEKQPGGRERKRRLTEVPAYIYGIKNDDSAYINKLCGENSNEQRQLNSMKHCYVYMDERGVLHKADVRLEERYHHRRPDDKSIGRAVKVEGGDSDFYQISSISQDQSFSGYIRGSREQIAKIREVLAADPACRAGYGSSAEYGKSRIYVTGRSRRLNREKYETDRIVAVLTSPAIVYSEKAMYSVRSADLLEEVLAACGLKTHDVESYTSYVKYTMLGGFNVTWGFRKPVISAFDQGTALDIKLCRKVSIDVENPIFIGERNLEGYGECRIEAADVRPEMKECPVAEIGAEERRAKMIDMKTAGLGMKIAEKLLNEYLSWKAAENAQKQADLVQEETRPVISDMLLMCRDMKNVDEISEAVKKRYDKTTKEQKQKKERAGRILNLCTAEKVQEIVDGFAGDYRLENFEPERERYRKTYLESLLEELKYQIRHQKGGERSEE